MGLSQKLVTIYLDRRGHRIPGVRASGEESHGCVQEHLENYLNDGWFVKAITGAGGAGTGSTRESGCGWVIVLLEKVD